MSTLIYREITVNRFPAREQEGRFNIPQDPVEFTIHGSLQPVGSRDRQFAPPGTYDHEDRMLYVRGDVELELGDIVFESDGAKFRVTSIHQDWRIIANYIKFRLRQVKE